MGFCIFVLFWGSVFRGLEVWDSRLPGFRILLGVRLFGRFRV